jgi:thiol-disulfide isomerase/thioredoxin
LEPDGYLNFMKRSAIILLFVLLVLKVQGQGMHAAINGLLLNDSLKNDSITLVKGLVAAKYFKNESVTVPIINNRFSLPGLDSYPQMYRVIFSSDSGRRVWRWGVIFIDNSTTSLKLDYLKDECINSNGAITAEFQNKFIPFMAGPKYDCSLNSFYERSSNEDPGFESKLIEYVRKNPSSYVALWSLVERFSLFGHTTIKESILNSFAQDIKSSKVWKTLRDDIQEALIKENARFPHINVKTTQLNFSELKLPKAKYILLDYWFSRCRPCLDTIPYLKRLYSRYHERGFEIVSISTDKTKDIAIWQQRIKEYGLIWPQYLDENAIGANRLAINSFPTTYLLDSNGIMIRKNISPPELEKLLDEKLK